MSGLNLEVLRAANAARLPEFKNSRGGPAHSKPDGSDWSPAQWLQALLGELGEWAEVRLAYEAGLITREEYEVKSEKELADVQTYLDILARRSLDRLVAHSIGEVSEVQGHPLISSPANQLMMVVACLGTYANHRKKLERGDYSFEQYMRAMDFESMRRSLNSLIAQAGSDLRRPSPDDEVANPHPTGVDLSKATVAKFNEVSARVGSRVRMAADRCWLETDG